MKWLLPILFLFVSSIASNAQVVITGKVIDAISGEPLPYVTINTFGTKSGSVTDFDGYFKIESSDNIDSISASFMGYVTQIKAVSSEPIQNIDFALTENVIGFKEIVVRPGGINPAEVIMKRARKKKKGVQP